MKVLRTTEQLRHARAETESRSWALVPTMGYLHAGHLSLVARARRENEVVGVSLFVNPTQFGEASDLQNYPRDLDRDLELLERERVDIVFAPDPEEMYPEGFQTYVTVEGVSRPLEGSSRPGHFRGVATVVAKLFLLFRPRRAYFGQKDVQQTVVLRRMVRDLGFDLELVVCPTVRESDGLAMSSRNARLAADERHAATVLYRALSDAERRLRDGERDAERLREAMADILATEPLARADYVSAADPDTLAELDRVDTAVILSLAAFVGPVRLIDNLLVTSLP